MATELAKAYVQIIPSAQGIQGSISSLMNGEATSAGEASGKNFASTFGGFAKKALVGLGIGKIVSDAVTNTSEFEAGMAKVSTLFTGTGEEFQQLTDDILGLSSAYGISTHELTEAAYSAESAGVAQEDLLYMLEHSAELAQAGFTDLDTALSATAKTMNAYGDAAGSVEDVQRVLMQTQNLGITTVGELGASLANVTPTAAAMGVGFEQVGAAMAQLTASGVQTAQATTQLRSAMTELGKSGTKADKAFRKASKGTKYAGMSFQEAMAAGANLGDVFGMMQAYADKSGVSMVDLWGSVEAGNAAMLIASDVDKFNSNLEQMATDADVVGEAYGKMANTFGHDMNRLKESAKNFMTALFTGGDISSSFDSMLSSLGDVGKKLIGWITKGLKGLGKNLPKLMSSLLDFGEALLSALGEVNWIELGTTIITGLIDALGTLGERVIGLFSDAVSSIADGDVDFASIGTAIWDGITSILSTGGEWMKTLFEAGKTAVEGINFGEIGTKIKEAVEGILGAAGDFLSIIFESGEQAVESAAEQEWPSVGDVIKTAVNLALNEGKFLSAVFEAGAELVKAINWKEVGTHVEDLIVAGLDGAATLVSTIGNAADELLTSVKWGEIGTAAGELLVAGIDGAAKIVDAISTAASDLVTGVKWEELGQASGELISAGLSGAADFLKAGFSGAVDFLNGVNWGEVGNNVIGGLSSAIEGAGGFLGGLLGGAGNILGSAGEFGGKAINSLSDLLFGGNDPVEAAKMLEQAMSSMESALEEGEKNIETAAKNVGACIRQSIEGELTTAQMNAIGSTLISDIDAGVTITEGDLDSHMETVGSTIAKSFGAAGDWSSVGSGIVTGIISGVKSSAIMLVFTMAAIAAQAVKAAKTALGIGSPSKVMRDQIGKWIPEGIAVGIDKNSDVVSESMNDLANDMSSGTMAGALSRQGRRIGSSGVASWTGGQAEDAGSVVSALEEALNRVNIYLGAEKVGNMTTRWVDRNIKADDTAVLRGMGA